MEQFLNALRAFGLSNANSTYNGFSSQADQLITGIKVSLLVDAIRKNDCALVLRLLDGGLIKINEQLGEQLNTPLHLAVQFESLSVIQTLLAYSDIDVNLADSDGDSPVSHAIRSLDSDMKTFPIVKLLLGDKNCQFAKENNDEVCALESSVAKGFKETTKLLIMDGRIKIYKNSQLQAAIELAINECYGALARLIWDEVDKEEQTKLAVAIAPDYESFLELLESKRKSYGKDSQGNSIESGSPVIVMNDPTDLKKRQLKHGLEAETEEEMKIVGKYATVSYIGSRGGRDAVIVISANQEFTLAPSNISLISKAKDSAGKEFGFGDQIQLIENMDELKELQTWEFGNWYELMTTLVNKTGVVVNLEVSPMVDQATDVIAKVKFGAMIFGFNPKALIAIV